MLQRKQVRLANYNYGSPGCYFVTLCCCQRQHYLGWIDESGWHPNKHADGVCSLWLSLPQRFPGLLLHSWCIMPNHFHGILELTCQTQAQQVKLHDPIRVFKSLSSKLFSPTKLWQRGFYDHVIRSECDFLKISKYIQNNHLQWQLDYFNSSKQ
ncbi:transposase [Rheinheimera sp.]|uniref:transposase n=1 Tax=Rheinheimera sp. TaxID=1869214 RepID=UPI00307E7ACC